jgi:hypothetical protein
MVSVFQTALKGGENGVFASLSGYPFEEGIMTYWSQFA